MKAAVVTQFGAPPQYDEVPAPVADREDEMVVDVLAAALHPRVRSQADGSHYTSTGSLPLVPGVDGVGRGPDGALRYFVLDDTTAGSFAERALIDVRRSVTLPESTDPVAIAAAMNPAMSSWLALRHRVAFEPGCDVLVLGATGSAGRLAVQVARLLGARRVVGAGRDPGRLAELPGLGATSTVVLGDRTDALADEAADVDVVLDYVWGETSAAAMAALVTARQDRARALSWIAIGSVAGRTAPIPSAALRACNLTIVGSGQGSVGTRQILGELPAIADAVTQGRLDASAIAVPLHDVTAAWSRASDGRRVVLVPAADDDGRGVSGRR